MMTANEYRNKYANQTEDGLIEQVVLFLNNSGFTAWRQQNTGKFNRTALITSLGKLFSGILAAAVSGNARSIKWDTVKASIAKAVDSAWTKVPNGIRGVPDVIGFEKKTGRWVACEIKIGNDRVSPEQADFMARLKASGGICFVVRNFEEFAVSFNRTVSR